MKIVQIQNIPDAQDAMDATHGNCVYLEDSAGNLVPIYLDNDRGVAWNGETDAGEKSIFEALKFITAFGYKPEIIYG